MTAGRAFGVWNNKDSTCEFKLPSGICTADVTFMGTSGVHKFHFTSDSAKASHVAWEHLDYDHTTNAFLLDHAFTHHGKHPQVLELPLPRVTRSPSPPRRIYLEPIWKRQMRTMPEEHSKFIWDIVSYISNLQAFFDFALGCGIPSHTVQKAIEDNCYVMLIIQ